MKTKELTMWSPPDGTREEKAYRTFDELERDYGLFIARNCLGYTEDKEPYSKKLCSLMYRIKRGVLPKIESEEEWNNLEKNIKKDDPEEKWKRKVAAQKAQKTKAINQLKKEQLTGSAAEALKQVEAEKPQLPVVKLEEEEVELCDPNQFLKVPYGLLQSNKWRSLRGLHSAVLLELIKRVINSKKQKDPYNLYSEFYKNNYLACCAKQKDLAKWFKTTRTNITKIIKHLEHLGLIQIHGNPKFKNTHIYVVGIVVENKMKYFIGGETECPHI